MDLLNTSIKYQNGEIINFKKKAKESLQDYKLSQYEQYLHHNASNLNDWILKQQYRNDCIRQNQKDNYHAFY